MRLTQRVAPDDLPVTQQEILKHLRITNTSPPDVADIMRIAEGCTRELEGPTGKLRRALMPQEWSLWLDCFPPCIRVPLPPLIKVCEINYLDTENAWQTLAEEKYRIIAGGEDRSEIIPEHFETWPATAYTLSSVEVRFSAGHEVDVPADIKNALLEMIALRYAVRDGSMFGTDRMLDDLPAVQALQRYRVYC